MGFLQSGDVVYMDWKLIKDSDSGKISGETRLCLLILKLKIISIRNFLRFTTLIVSITQW